MVGSQVSITVRRADGSEETVQLRRAPMSYVHLTQVPPRLRAWHLCLCASHKRPPQVYYELYDQLKSSTRELPDAPDLVKRLGSKVREIDRYYSHVVDELESERFLLSRRVAELEGDLPEGVSPGREGAEAEKQLELAKAAEKREMHPKGPRHLGLDDATTRAPPNSPPERVQPCLAPADVPPL